MTRVKPANWIALIVLALCLDWQSTLSLAAEIKKTASSPKKKTTGTALDQTRSVRLVFGVSLRGLARALLTEVETTFGRPIKEEWLDQSDMAGKSEISEEGEPVVKINPRTGRNSATIVHELYHLKLRAAGYPAVAVEVPSEMNTENNRRNLLQLKLQVHDPIVHSIFYPEVRRRYGINPGAAFEAETQEALDDGRLQRIVQDMNEEAAALYWFKIALEVSNTRLKRRLEAMLQRLKKQAGLDLAQELVKIVRDAAPSDPQKAISTFVQVLNRLYHSRFLFRELRWESQMPGKVSTKEVIITMSVL